MRDTGVTSRGSNFFLFLFFLLISLSFEQGFSQRAYIFDYDGTIVEDRADLGGNHKTTYRLFRINYRGSTFQSEIQGPAFIDVSHADWEKLTTPKYDPITKHPQYPLLLARGEGKLGSTTPYRLTDGRFFIPGHYTIMSPDTFIKYNENPGGENYFETAFSEAVKQTRKRQGRVQGEAFHTFYELVNNPETIAGVYVISARGHSFEEIFEKLKNDRDKRKLIQKHVTNTDLESLARRHIMMMRQEYHHFDNGMGQVETRVQKANFIAEIAKALLHVNPADYVTMLDSSGERTIRGIEIVYFEDRYEYIEEVVRELQDIVNRRKNLKVVVHNAGRAEDIERSERPKTYVLTPFSTERELTDREVREETALKSLFQHMRVSPKKSRSKTVKTCSRYFGGV